MKATATVTLTAKPCPGCKLTFKPRGAATYCIPCASKRNVTCACGLIFQDDGSSPVCNLCAKGRECVGCKRRFASKTADDLCAGCTRAYTCTGCQGVFDCRSSTRVMCPGCAKKAGVKTSVKQNATCMRCTRTYWSPTGSQVCKACVLEEKCDLCQRMFWNYHIKGREQLCAKCVPGALLVKRAVRAVVPVAQADTPPQHTCACGQAIKGDAEICRKCFSTANANATCSRCPARFYTKAGSSVCAACVTFEECAACKRKFKNFHIAGREQLCSKCKPAQ